MKNVFRSLFAVLTIGFAVKITALIFAPVNWFVETWREVTHTVARESMVFIALTVGVAMFFKPKIQAFINRVLDRYDKPDCVAF